MLKMNYKSKNINHMTQFTKWPILATCIGSLLFLNSVSAQTYYKWVDKAGSTHYTQTPPPGSLARKAKAVQVDETPVPQYASNNQSNNLETNNGSNTSVLNANQLAQAANAGSVPNSPPQVAQPTNPQPMVQPAPRQNNVNGRSRPITPPSANRLITPTQDQSRPAFSEQ